MEQLDLFSWRRGCRRSGKPKGPREWKIVAVRETAPDTLPYCVNPDDAVKYWRENIATAPHFNPEVECFAVILVNIKRRIRGHHVVSIGGLNETFAHPREVFRAAVIGAAWGVVLMHNHPSGDPTPSNADRTVTRRLQESGRILEVEVLDHVIVGNPTHCSFVAAGLL